MTLEIPADNREWAKWLEQRLVTADIEHVSQLLYDAIPDHVRPSLQETTLKEVFGSHLQTVLTTGLQSLPSDVIHVLRRHPELLPDLQQLILISGGPLWQQKVDAVHGVPPTFDASPQVSATTSRTQTAAARGPVQPSVVSRSTPPRSSARWGWLGWVAASTVIGWNIYGWLAPDEVAAWGLGRLAANPPQVASSQEYLQRVAAVMREVTDDPNRLQTPADFRDRLSQYSEGITRFLSLSHSTLSTDDRNRMSLLCVELLRGLEQLHQAQRQGKPLADLRNELHFLVDGVTDKLETAP